MSIHHNPQTTEAQVKIAQVMAGESAILHELDFQDVAISANAVRTLKKAAIAVMQRFMPGSRPETLTNSQAVAFFIDRVFWDQDTKGLVLCADIAQRSFCIPIPSDHWHLKDDLGVIQ
ncbi:hypothetical protein [Maridesulfovibrio hydrothermalis]|uniref:Uncharacterized protein n=1 Tax=Maridesulfovibrio hydrothermalis AM13 = DSM 14728 TaxID=1121451 RepID=L0REY4_9BACT|nr:hypothetical protein [Maridesulfovibrio hydrothermalis]CCO25343.1 conserved protein of unknown function [Maridesulfovibrio hydrothermalis AM13 = DSM 14728]